MGFLRLLRFAPRRHFCSTSGCPPTPNPNLDPKHITAAINSLYKERDIDSFLSRFRHLSAASPLFRTKYGIYEVAVRRLADALRFEDAAAIVESRQSHADEFPSRDGFSAEIISLYGKAGMPNRASEAFRQLPTPRGVVPFTAYLAALGDPDQVVLEFRSVAEEDPEIVPDVVSYGTVIRALCEKGDLDAAMEMLDEMQEKGVQPNVVVFNTLMNAFYKSDRSDDADKIWAKMAQKNCEPNVRTFNGKLRWLVSVGKTTEAVELFNEMEGRGIKPDGYSFTALITGYCKDGKLKKAKKMHAELRKQGCGPTPGTYEALLPRVCEAGDFELAINLCNESMNRKCFINVNVLHSVVDWLVKYSRLQDAKKLVETAWYTYYSKESLPMPAACLSRSSELKNEMEEGNGLHEGDSIFNEHTHDVPKDANLPEASEKGLSAKIGIIVKSFEKPKYFGAFGVAPDKNRVKLPTTRTLITVLRSPHIDKKSREQFEMKVRREYIIIKCQPHELHKKYFWFKRTRILGAQFELVFSYKTRLDMSRLKALI